MHYRNRYILLNVQLTAMESQYPVKEEEENAMHNTVVIFSSNDSFTLKQVCPFFFFCLEGAAPYN